MTPTKPTKSNINSPMMMMSPAAAAQKGNASNLQQGAEAIEIAQAHLQELLQHPDDLASKVPFLRRKIMAEKAILDNMLVSGVRNQLDDIRKGLSGMSECRLELKEVEATLEAIDKSSAEAQQVMDHFDFVRLVCRMHQNISSARMVYLRFQELGSEIERVSTLLKSDRSQGDLCGDNLLLIHYHLTRLDEFRGKTMFQARESGTEITRILEKFFDKLDKLVERFEKYLFTLARHMLIYAANGEMSLIVRIMKVIEFEELADEKALHLESSSAKKEPSSSSLPRKLKSYRNLLMNTLHISIVDNFKEIMTDEVTSSLIMTLEKLNFVIDDLSLIQNELVPRFPRKYKIFDFFVLAYHGQVYQVLKMFIDSKDKRTQDLPYLIDWVNNTYYAQMNDKLSVPRELLEPKLLDDQDELLIQEYVKDIKKQVNNWYSNVLSNATRYFNLREGAPETDAKGCYIYSGIVVDIFNIIRQQVEHTLRFSKSKMLLDVVLACFSALIDLQGSLVKVIDAEMVRYKNGTEIAEGLESYLAAFSNSFLIGCENLEEIGRKAEREIDEQYKSALTEEIERSSEAVSKCSRHCYMQIVECMFWTVREPCVKHLFTAPKWYVEALVEIMMETFRDYLDEMKAVMAEANFNRFTTEVIERFIVSYWEAIRNRNAKLKATTTTPGGNNEAGGGALAIIDQDYEVLVRTFQEYKPLKRLEKLLRPLHFLRELVAASDEIALVKFYELKGEYPDVKETLLEDVLTKREDLNRSQVRSMMEKIKKKIKEEAVRLSESGKQVQQNVNTTVTLFSRIKD